MSLLSHVPEDTSPRVIVVKPEMPAPSPLRPNGMKAQHETPVYDPALVYVLELATILALRDEETISALGADAADALQVVIRDAERLHHVTTSRAVFYLLSLLRASNDHGYIRAPIVLHAISSFRPDLLKQCAQPILKGIYGCISGPAELRNEVATSPDFWSVMHTLQAQADTAPMVFQIAEAVTTGPNPAITADNYEAAISLLNAFATAGSAGAAREQQREPGGRRGGAQEKNTSRSEVVVRGTKAMTVVSQLASRVPGLIEHSHLENEKAWHTYWSPILRCLTTQCTNPCREIRQQAFTSLQRCLMSTDLASDDHKEWTNIFGEVLFPLINQLLKPEVYQTDPHGMGETRVQAAQLLCKIFLHYLVQLSEWEGVLDLWVKILTIMDRLINSGQSDNIVEAVPESLKNVLLVMSSGQHLVPPSDKGEQTEQQKQLWTETWMRLDRFLPGLMPELFPEQVEKAAAGRQKQPVDQVASANVPATQIPERPASVAEPQAA